MRTNNWIRCQLADLIDIKHGFAFKGEFFRDEPPGDILLTPGNFAIGGGFKGDKLKWYSGVTPEEYILGEGDLIVTMTDLSKDADTLGYPALVPKPEKGQFLHNQRLGKIIIRKNAQILREFLYYLLCTREYRHEVISSATGTTVKHTSPSRIMRFGFFLPPLPEQHAIAEILGSLDDKIELNRRMNATLEAMAAALFKAWFVDSEEAKGWEVGKLGEDFNLTMGQSPPGETYNENGDGLPFFQGRADFGFRFPTNRIYCTAPTRFAESGDSLVSVRAPVGDVNMAAEKCAIGRGVASIRHNTGSRSYTYYAMKFLQEDFARFEGEGTVFGSINKSDFQSLRISLPPAGIVQSFEELCYPIDQKIENNENESRTLSALRDTLLPRLMRGEVRVKDLA